VTSVAWAADNQTLFYTQEDPVTKRSDRLFRLKLGSTPEQVYYEPVEQFTLEVGTTKDRVFVIVHAQSTDTTEDWAIPADKPTTAMRSVLGRQTGHRYDTDSHNGQFLIRTNRNARNFRLCPRRLPHRMKHTTTIAEHQNDGLITGFEVFEHYLAVAENRRH
jgi:oligopeptidase B